MALTEGWILAGELDGVTAYPPLETEVCGIPHVLRLACDLAMAGATKIVVIWNVDGALPVLDSIARDERLASRARLLVVRTPPDGDPRDTIVISRADRFYHRDMPKLAIAASKGGKIGMIEGDEHDGVFAADRATARRLVAEARAPRGLARLRTCEAIATAPVPYAGFTARASGPHSLRVAERRLVWSLRKAADGLAAKAINRHVSLRVSLRLASTRIRPNHVTLAALALAIAGGCVIGTGGYLAGVVGMLLVELGSIVDGVDGELARLRFQFSRAGEWLDTIVDDIANVAYVSGVIASLAIAGKTWAIPLGAAALVAFAITQTTQYALIRFVYRSGDLAAIPWAFQSSGFLAQSSLGATLAKCLKRDFVVTVFFVLAIFGRLDLVLIGFSAGAFTFFGVFAVQLARNYRRTAASTRATGAAFTSRSSGSPMN